jgi:hypothetical protein
MLTLAATTAFADNRATAQNAAPAATTQQAKDPNVVSADYQGITKDGKQIKINMSFKMLDHGPMPSPQFGQALTGTGNLLVMQEFVKYKSDELAANMPAIEKAVTEGMSKFLMMGATPKGEVIYAKPGVNYGPVVVNKVQDSAGKTLYEKKTDAPKTAPATKPAAVKNA